LIYRLAGRVCNIGLKLTSLQHRRKLVLDSIDISLKNFETLTDLCGKEIVQVPMELNSSAATHCAERAHITTGNMVSFYSLEFGVRCQR